MSQSIFLFSPTTQINLVVTRHQLLNPSSRHFLCLALNHTTNEGLWYHPSKIDRGIRTYWLVFRNRTHNHKPIAHISVELPFCIRRNSKTRYVWQVSVIINITLCDFYINIIITSFHLALKIKNKAHQTLSKQEKNESSIVTHYLNITE